MILLSAAAQILQQQTNKTTAMPSAQQSRQDIRNHCISWLLRDRQDAIHASHLALCSFAGGAAQQQQQQQMGPLLAGRLAAMAAMRQLRRSSVGESPDVVASSGSLQGSRRSLSALATAGTQPGHSGSTVVTEGDLRSSYAAAIGNGIGRGRLTAAEAAVPGALTSSHSFGSGGVPGYQDDQQQQQQQAPVVRRLSAQQRHQQQEVRRSIVQASVSSAISNEGGCRNQDEECGANNNT